MAVIMISTQHVKDWDLLAEYRKGAGPIVRRHGGELLGRSNAPDTLHGEAVDSVVVFRFPDRAAVDAWLADPDYQPLKQIRDQAAQMSLILIDAV
ncbi:MAG: DUF1330 domain-containing protein [Immundisolibacter sp.]|uniref:DUF1330 domain-containing protein n=1 Tax=Immundisolibacter sp. TaxID=1934948 RepID=UPI003D0AF91C